MLSRKNDDNSVPREDRLGLQPTESTFSRCLYRVCHALCYVLSKVLFRAQVAGAENVPAEGGVIFASNHRSYADPPLLGSMLPRPVHFAAKAELFQGRFLGWLIRNLNAFPVRRSGDVREMLRRSLEILKAGGALLLFPEGTRGKTDELLPPMPGIGLLAERGHAPVVPIYIHNTWRILPLGSSIIRPYKLYVCIGKPIPPPTRSDGQERPELHAEFAERVMDEIKCLRSELLRRIGHKTERVQDGMML